MTVFMLVTLSLSAFAQWYQVTLNDFTVFTKERSIRDALRTDSCARALARSVMGQVVREENMEEGVDLADVMEVSVLERVSLEGQLETYSISFDSDADHSYERQAQMKRTGNRCKTLSLSAASL